MSALLRRILAVARTEWRVTWRGLGLKLVMVILAVPFVPYLLQPRTTFDDDGLHIFTFVAPLFGLLAAFLIVPGPRRERSFRTAELTWVRPLDSFSYMAGKLAAVTLVMAVLLAELTVLVAVTQAASGFPLGPGLAANALLLVAPTLLCIAALYLVFGALLPHPLLGYLLAIVIAFGFMFFFTQSSIYLWNPYLVAFSYSKALGFGPDGPLLLANRLFFIGLAVTLAGIAVAAFARRERRALAPRWQAAGAAAVLVCGAASMGGGLLRFQTAQAAVMVSGLVIAPTPVPLDICGYSLDLRIDPANGGEEGVASFTVRNDGAVPISTLPLHLNDGLRIDAATVNGRAVPVRNSPQFGYLTLAPALPPLDSAAVRVTFAGRFKLLHVIYGHNQAGIQTGQMMAGITTAVFPSYIWNGQAMLYRDGDWFPTPWTQAALQWQPAPLDWRALTIRLPVGANAIASSGGVRLEGQNRVFNWRLGGGLPQIVLAVPPAGYRYAAVAGGTVAGPESDVATLRARYGPYVMALRDLDRFFGRTVQPITVVAMPLPGAFVYTYPVPAAIGGSLALVQPGGVDASINAFAPLISRLATPAGYRAALGDLAMAWWDDHLPERPMTQLFDGRHPSNPLPPDLPNGYVGLSEQDGGSSLLPEYTAAATAAQRLGPAFYEREMALRRAIAALGRRDANNNQTLYNVVYLGQGPLARELQALGLLGRLDNGGLSYDVSPALDDLRRAIGPARVRSLLIAISRAGATPSDDASAACALYHLTGKPVSAWMNHYLPAFSAIKPAGGCR